MKTLNLFSALILLFLQAQLLAQEYHYLGNNESLTGIAADKGITSPVTITVLYDNYTHVEGMLASWGFSAVIEGLEKEILFDTGTKPELFMANFSKSGIDPKEIDMLVLSHEHLDHTGGIPAFVKMKTGIPVIIPHSFTETFIVRADSMGLKPVLVDKPAMICKHLYTSGEFDYPLAEQALVLNTKQGLVVMTGCSHPGINDMLKDIKDAFNRNIYMVFGGFHLLEKSDEEMDAIITEMKSLGVVKCGATHCTGERQISMFRDAFGENYFELGAGNTIIIN